MLTNKTNLVINCDMGEWDASHLIPCDDKIMPLVDMCNIACGAHAGSKNIIESTIQLAIDNNVQIGAHPSFEDRENFGRSYISLTQQQLFDSLKKQLNVFLSSCSKLKIQPYHVKAHGALYHACNQNEKEATALIKSILEVSPNLVLLVAPESRLEKLAQIEGINTLAESFIDRRYNDDLTLVSRSEKDAVILESNKAVKQYEYLSKNKILTSSGKLKSLVSSTACIHGDNPNALVILKSIHKNG